jgi:hypothetical protein
MTTYTVTEAQFEQLLTIARLYALAYPYPVKEWPNREKNT